MNAQLPREVAGLAAGVLIYSTFCVLFGCLTGYLIWVHRDRTSYAFLVAVFTTISTLASMAQQVHTIVRWRDIKIEQYHHGIANAGSPELAVAGLSVGLDLGLFYVQFACYNVESLLLLFWCIALVQSVFQLSIFHRPPPYLNIVAKLMAVVIPIIFVSILQADSIRASPIAFFGIANVCMIIGLSGSAFLLLVTLGRYIHTKRQLMSWNVRYGRSSAKSDIPTLASANTGFQSEAIYDRWLLARFTLGALGLGAFQLVIILFEASSASQNRAGKLGDSPDLSIKRAEAEFQLFLPGVTPPLLAFIVFGTTKPLCDYMWKKFVPNCLKRKCTRRRPSSQNIDNIEFGSRTRESQVVTPHSDLRDEAVSDFGRGKHFYIRENSTEELSILDKTDRTYSRAGGSAA